MYGWCVRVQVCLFGGRVSLCGVCICVSSVGGGGVREKRELGELEPSQ